MMMMMKTTTERSTVGGLNDEGNRGQVLEVSQCDGVDVHQLYLHVIQLE